MSFIYSHNFIYKRLCLVFALAFFFASVFCVNAPVSFALDPATLSAASVDALGAGLSLGSAGALFSSSGNLGLADFVDGLESVGVTLADWYISAHDDAVYIGQRVAEGIQSYASGQWYNDFVDSYISGFVAGDPVYLLDSLPSFSNTPYISNYTYEGYNFTYTVISPDGSTWSRTQRLGYPWSSIVSFQTADIFKASNGHVYQQYHYVIDDGRSFNLNIDVGVMPDGYTFDPTLVSPAKSLSITAPVSPVLAPSSDPVGIRLPFVLEEKVLNGSITDADVESFLNSYVSQGTEQEVFTPVWVVIDESGGEPEPSPSPSPSPSPTVVPVLPPSVDDVPIGPSEGQPWILDNIGNGILRIIGWLSAIASLMGQYTNQIVSAIGSWSPIEIDFTQIGNWLGEVKTALQTGFASVIDGISVGFTSAVQSIINSISSLSTSISSWFSSIGSKIDTIIDTISNPPQPPDIDIDPVSSPAPLLPYGSYSPFNFSGIWHYVTEWLACISNFISLVGEIWSNLPYCMVVPVYACLTIIIVFGVLRKLIGL